MIFLFKNNKEIPLTYIYIYGKIENNSTNPSFQGSLVQLMSTDTLEIDY